MHLRKPACFAFLLACGFLGRTASAAPPAAPPAEPKACEGIGDPSFFRDEGINIKVSTRLRFNKALMRETIQTKTNGGIVTLHGYVSTADHARLAAKLAAEVGGVRCVSNFIVVGPPPPQPAGNPY